MQSRLVTNFPFLSLITYGHSARLSAAASSLPRAAAFVIGFGGACIFQTASPAESENAPMRSELGMVLCGRFFRQHARAAASSGPPTPSAVISPS